MRAVMIADGDRFGSGSVASFINHRIQLGGSDGDGYCYEHQSFECLDNLTEEESDALKGATDLEAGECKSDACVVLLEQTTSAWMKALGENYDLSCDLHDAHKTIARLELALEAACMADVPDETIVKPGCCAGACACGRKRSAGGPVVDDPDLPVNLQGQAPPPWWSGTHDPFEDQQELVCSSCTQEAPDEEA